MKEGINWYKTHAQTNTHVFTTLKIGLVNKMARKPHVRRKSLQKMYLIKDSYPKYTLKTPQ